MEKRRLKMLERKLCLCIRKLRLKNPAQPEADISIIKQKYA